jgi:sialate O-acetylesterase
VISSGPVFDRMMIDAQRAIVFFSHGGSGLRVQGDRLRGFTLAGADGIYHPADAIVDGETVIVSSEKVTTPKHVRYCWAKVPDGNLCNSVGLPAVPFRSDDSIYTIQTK